MKKIKEIEIYPKFEVRLDHREKEWLLRELEILKTKFSEPGFSVGKNTLVLAALRHGIQFLKNRKRLSAAGVG